jgi:hypothetical protein
MDLRSSALERNTVHGIFHQIEAAPVFGTKVFESQRIGNRIGFESKSLIPDDDGHSLATFAAAADVNQLARVRAIAVEHRVAQSLPKSEFNGLLLSENTPGSNYQAHEPIHKRCDQTDLASHPGVHR